MIRSHSQIEFGHGNRSDAVHVEGRAFVRDQLSCCERRRRWWFQWRFFRWISSMVLEDCVQVSRVCQCSSMIFSIGWSEAMVKTRGCLMLDYLTIAIWLVRRSLIKSLGNWLELKIGQFWRRWVVGSNDWEKIGWRSNLLPGISSEWIQRIWPFLFTFILDVDVWYLVCP